jgi:hypothetical protein
MGITVSGEAVGSIPFSENTFTVVVNAHGALILLDARVAVGQLLTVKNVKTEEELYCQVVHLGPAKSGKLTVGIKFMQPSPRFWRIAFPPADWTPHSPEAKKATPRVIAIRKPA